MAESININAYQRAVETLVSEGHVVIQVFVTDDSAYYFLAHKFVPAQKTPNEDIKFNQVIGLNITDFVRNNNLIDRSAFLHKLNALISDTNTNVVRFEFPNTVRWFKFANAAI